MQTPSVSEARAEAAAMVVQALLRRLDPAEFQRLQDEVLPEKIRGLLRALPWAEFAEVMAEANKAGLDLGSLVVMDEMNWILDCRS